jgi:hypothetical protein
MIESWADLLDSRPYKLKHFGSMNPGLKQVYDPSIEHLAQRASTMAFLFTMQAEKQG